MSQFERFYALKLLFKFTAFHSTTSHGNSVVELSTYYSSNPANASTKAERSKKVFSSIKIFSAFIVYRDLGGVYLRQRVRSRARPQPRGQA